MEKPKKAHYKSCLTIVVLVRQQRSPRSPDYKNDLTNPNTSSNKQNQVSWRRSPIRPTLQYFKRDSPHDRRGGIGRGMLSLKANICFKCIRPPPPLVSNLGI